MKIVCFTAFYKDFAYLTGQLPRIREIRNCMSLEMRETLLHKPEVGKLYSQQASACKLGCQWGQLIAHSPSSLLCMDLAVSVHHCHKVLQIHMPEPCKGRNFSGKGKQRKTAGMGGEKAKQCTRMLWCPCCWYFSCLPTPAPTLAVMGQIQTLCRLDLAVGYWALADFLKGEKGCEGFSNQ